MAAMIARDARRDGSGSAFPLGSVGLVALALVAALDVSLASDPLGSLLNVLLLGVFLLQVSPMRRGLGQPS